MRAVLRYFPRTAAANLRFSRRPTVSPRLSTCSSSSSSEQEQEGLLLLTEKPSGHRIPSHLLPSISSLASFILSYSDPPLSSLDSFINSSPPDHLSSLESILSSSPKGSAFVELLSRLRSRPHLALQVFSWRLQRQDTHPVQSEEYVKAITLAGRARDIALARDLFLAAEAADLLTPSTYNALMAVYMYNGERDKALAVFDDLLRDGNCRPTIVTYNILLSIFGRLVLVDRMEEILMAVRKSDLQPNISTYNTLIAGYLMVSKWDKMEGVFEEMKGGPVEPDTDTYLLMIRGLASAGYLEKMEEMYALVREHVHEHEVPLLRTMICAYCKSKDPDRVRKIEDLLGHIPDEQYRPWMNVLLIRLYADEGLMARMESLISEAFEHDTAVMTVGIMKSIITSYFRCDAVDRLAKFTRQAEAAGWRMFRSVYHCKMVMYGRQQRFLDMLGVVDEMEVFKIKPCKKTFWIMYHAYMDFGDRSHAEKILGSMCKLGFGIPADILDSRVRQR